MTSVEQETIKRMEAEMGVTVRHLEVFGGGAATEVRAPRPRPDQHVILSSGTPLNGVGPSRPMTKIHEAFAAAFGEKYHCFEPKDFPQLKDVDFGQHAQGAVFDDVAEDAVTDVVHATRGQVVFVGSGGASFNQLRHFGQQSARPTGITLYFSSHWAMADRILREEYPKFGIAGQGVHPYLQWRAGREQEYSDLIVVPSEACKATYPKELQDKVRVVNFGVDVEKFRPPPGGRVRESGAPLQIVAQMTNPARKGLDAILRAWQTLPVGKYKLTITGTPGFTTRWARTQKVQLKPGITEVGWCSEEMLQTMYAQADVVLQPSLEEGQALAALESIACGIPVIATEAVACPCSFIVPPNDPEAIGVALERIRHGTREEYAQWSKDARSEAEKHPWSRFQADFVSLVKGVM